MFHLSLLCRKPRGWQEGTCHQACLLTCVSLSWGRGRREQMRAGVGESWWGCFIALVPLQVASGWPPPKPGSWGVALFSSQPFPGLPSSHCSSPSLSRMREGWTGSLASHRPSSTCGFLTCLHFFFVKKTKLFIEPSSNNPNLSVWSVSSGTLSDTVSLWKKQSTFRSSGEIFHLKLNLGAVDT